MTITVGEGSDDVSSTIGYRPRVLHRPRRAAKEGCRNHREQNGQMLLCFNAFPVRRNRDTDRYGVSLETRSVKYLEGDILDSC